jgi:phosphatidylserine decarboxylase
MLRLLVNPAASRPFGVLMKRPASRLFIKRFIKRNKIDMKEYKNVKYKSFNDFFIREIKEDVRSFPHDKNDLAAPCDGKLTAYTITEDNVFYIKNSVYDVASMLQDQPLADEFVGGVCLIFRLTPDDYHRYHYIDDGEIISWKKIAGVLHTVRPISNERYNVYVQNAREYTVLNTENYGKIIQMEVGALFVGRIINYETSGMFRRGDEKGMFEFGGSTVVMLFQKDKVKIDESIYSNTRQNKETIVKLGEKIGEKVLL